ncbi:MAG: hypothetical protein CV089_08535 [Nitrospira sp. WS110]|nr:hypothetical protein [Nitrospira sp. WS110]
MLTILSITLAIATLLMLVIHPVTGVILLFISKPIIDATWDQPIVLEMPVTQIISGLVPIALLSRMLLANMDESLRAMPLRGLWILYVCYAGVFSLLIFYNQGPQSGANIFFRCLNGMTGFYMLQAFFHKAARLKIVLLAMVIGGLFPIGVGLYQIATGATWQAQNVEGISRNIGLYHDAITIRHYALQTILATLLLGSLFTHQHIVYSIGRLLYMATATIVMAKAYSKAGFLTLGIWAALWNGLQKRFVTISLMILLGLLVGTYYASQQLGDILQIFHKEIAFVDGKGDAHRTLNGRWYIWQTMFSEWVALDWLAKTFGSGKVALGAHNDYFQMLFHGGIVGLAIYVTLLGSIGFRILTNLREKVDPLTIAALMAFLCWLVDTIGLVPSSYSGYQWFIWGIIGLSLRRRALENAFVSVNTENTEIPNSISSHQISSTTREKEIPIGRFPILSDKTGV